MNLPIQRTAPLRIGIIDDSPLRGHGLLFVNLIRDRMLTHGVKLVGYHSLQASEGQPWCVQHQVSWLASSLEFRDQVDAIIIPAASTPESHHQLLKLAMPLGVPVYLDKPFASSEEEGACFFEMAEAHGISLMSASALRFCREVKELKERYPSPNYLEIWSGWREKFDEFFIHPAELFAALIDTSHGTFTRSEIGKDLLRYEFIADSVARGSIQLNSGDQGFSIVISDQKGWHLQTIESAFFVDTIEAIFQFFRSGEPLLTTSDTLNVLRIVDCCRELNRVREPAAI